MAAWTFSSRRRRPGRGIRERRRPRTGGGINPGFIKIRFTALFFLTQLSRGTYVPALTGCQQPPVYKARDEMQNLTKRNLAIRIAEETGLTQQQVVAVIQKTLDSIVEALRTGQTIEFRKFGVFDVRERRQRIGRNPHKPDQVVVIPSRKVVRFRPGKTMKEMFK
ncbi:MAG: integration host factor subunit beta [Kiritimatiellae bacterium]|nr:integration host factor subunit beta [Kiritimatiellia bacterium]NLD89351.1 integration host factor subunit beta [Lentisphaerota bacterium]HPC19985.1 HU family DNA-binding protein [Kiritimatiellia bacterium]HQN79430.1 HU family DNA-binding protein [Kiritimatiellia bacterium]HQQ60599.1 HU family DNA-binding protein [Kiritimatiellia bacterium]